MALTTIQTLFVKQQAQTAGAGPAVNLQLRAFWKWLAGHKGSPYLYFKSFANLGADAVVVDAANTLFFVYVKKQATATDAFYKIFDDATDDSTEGDAMHCIGLTTASDVATLFFPKGFVLAAGLVHGSYTALNGYNATTPSTSGDGPDGFVIVGDPAAQG